MENFVAEIISKVKCREMPPCRPVILADQEGITPPITKLMQMCWEDEAGKRPSFTSIRDYIVKKIQHGKYGASSASVQSKVLTREKLLNLFLYSILKLSNNFKSGILVVN